MRWKPNKLQVGILLGVEVVGAVLAWRDLARRSDDQVRGPKNLWRAFTLLNPGNAAAYWIFGRR
jgi:hypothetical protein